MTCIAGIEHDGAVWMAADSAALDGGYGLTLMDTKKVFITGEILFGVSGSMRVANLLQYGLEIPKQAPDVDDMTYLVCTVVESIRSRLKQGGVGKTDESQDVFGPGDILLGYNGKLYLLDTDYQIIRDNRGYAAIGSGGDVALGILWYTHHRDLSPRETHHRDLSPRERLKATIFGACDHNAGCALPMSIISLENRHESSGA
jgi:ATP-dependent protease HslVU (ClpYQ) peptidase subunit